MSRTEAISRYAKEIPGEIKSVIKGLDDDIRVAIVVLLLKKNRLSFMQLKSELHIKSNSSLSHHLTILQNGGLVNNHVELKKDKHVSFYTATDLSMEILRSLFDVILIPPGKSIDSPRSTVATSLTSSSSGMEELPYLYEFFKSMISWSLASKYGRKVVRYKMAISPQLSIPYASSGAGT